MDIRPYTGVGVFGPAYRIMLENDPHAEGSVDRVLLDEMVCLCPETAEYLYGQFTPAEVDYAAGSRPILEQVIAEVRPASERQEDLLRAITALSRQLGADAEPGLGALVFGGTEEEVIERKSDWCTDVARVACVLCQVAGIPARIANIFDTGQAYSGHVIIEAYRRRAWGAIDPLAGVIYLEPDGRPASVLKLMHSPSLVEGHRNAAGNITNRPGQFRAAAIVNYPVAGASRYDYTTSGPNDYTMAILEMSIRGWPGGLRWLHGEAD